jgi:endonuclease III
MPDHYELQWKLIYAMFVANKTAKFANAKVDKMQGLLGWTMPFEAIAKMDDAQLEALLRKVGTGQYARLTRGLRELVNTEIDPYTCDPDELQAIHGIGPKTARFFVMWTRPDEARYAVLDVHVLRWLHEQGHRRIPTQTPNDMRSYKRVEQIFLKEAAKHNMTPRELDLIIWEAGASAANTAPFRRVCVISGYECLAPAAVKTGSGVAEGNGSARATCFACGEPVCTNCSALVYWRGESKRRICANCLESRR